MDREDIVKSNLKDSMGLALFGQHILTIESSDQGLEPWLELYIAIDPSDQTMDQTPFVFKNKRF